MNQARDTGIFLIHVLGQESTSVGWPESNYVEALEACRNCNLYDLGVWNAACRMIENTNVENPDPINAWLQCVKSAAQLAEDACRGAPDDRLRSRLRNVVVALLVWSVCEHLKQGKEPTCEEERQTAGGGSVQEGRTEPTQHEQPEATPAEGEQD